MIGWALFLLGRNLELPDRHLLGWWMTKPDSAAISTALGYREDEGTPPGLEVDTANLLGGAIVKFGPLYCQLREISEGAQR